MKSRTQTYALALAGSAFGLVAALAVSSMAENTELDSGPRVFPYHGILEFDGRPVSSPMDLKVTVSDRDNTCVFTEEHASVPFDEGAFTVVVGQVNNGVSNCIWDKEEIYLQIALRPVDDNPLNNLFVTLSTRQRIFPTPFAYWAADADDLRVDGNMTTTNVNGAQGVIVTGNVSAATVDISGSSTVEIGGNFAADNLISSLTRNGTTTINASTTINNGPQMVGAATVEGNVTLAGANPDVSTGAIENLTTINSDGTAWAIGGNVTVSGNIKGRVTTTSTSGTNQVQGTLTSDVNGVRFDIEGPGNFGNQTTDTFTANDSASFMDCRLCLLWGDNNQAEKGYACTRMSGFDFNEVIPLKGDVNSDDHAGLAFLCDGVGSETSTIRANNPWPHQ